MNNKQRKDIRALRPELQSIIIEQAKKGTINFNKSEQQPVDIGMFQELTTKGQAELF